MAITIPQTLAHVAADGAHTSAIVPGTGSSAAAPDRTCPTPGWARSPRGSRAGLSAWGSSRVTAFCILAGTRPEWLQVQFACAAARAVVVPIYPSNSPEECEWVLGNSGAVAVFCEDAAQLLEVE